MEPREVLEALVAVVATLGELAADTALPDGDVVRAVSPRSLRAALRTFIWHVRCTLNHQSVTPLGQHAVTPRSDNSISSLGKALATLKLYPNADLCRRYVTDACRIWQESVAAIRESWDRLAEEATKLQDDWENAPTRSGERPGLAQRPLERLVAACDKATVFPWELLRRLGDTEAALEETREESPNVPEAAVAAVAEAERLWKASACLTMCHLLGTLGDIHRLLVSRAGSPARHAVAERCQKAIEDIPRLLQGQ